MSYVVKASITMKGTFDVIQTDSNVRIELSLSKKIANSVARKLNLGGGFAYSHVPIFFANQNKQNCLSYK